MEFLIKASQLLLSLSILVFLHELGHFIPARIFKTRVEKFYLFFNPWFSIVKKKIGDTEWGIGWLPLGGFVKISGMIDESMDKEQMAKPPQPWEFRSKPAWQRLIIMIGGVTVNLLLGFLIYILVLFTWGDDQLHTKDLQNGLAVDPFMEQYDLRSGDNILAINGEEVINPMDINKGILIRDHYELTVERPNGNVETIILPENIEYDLFENGVMVPFSMRSKKTVVEHVTTRSSLKISDDKEIPLGSGIMSFDGKALKTFPKNLSYVDFKDKASVKVEYAYGEDTLEVDVPGDKMRGLFNRTPALHYGLRPGDSIMDVAGNDIIFFDEIVTNCFANKGKRVETTVLRNGKVLSILPKVDSAGIIGFSTIRVDYDGKEFERHIDYGFGASIGSGFSMGLTTLGDYVGQLKFLFTSKGAQSVGGFGSIGGMFPSTWDWHKFWLNTALISIILAFMNILPIPALDGGHVVFLLYEIVTGREAPQKVLEYAQVAGFVFLMGLLLYANGNDIYRWFTGA